MIKNSNLAALAAELAAMPAPVRARVIRRNGIWFAFIGGVAAA